MTDPYADWLDEHLGAMVRYHIQADPRVAQRYAQAFDGDPVGAQWLGTVGGGTTTATAPADVPDLVDARADSADIADIAEIPEPDEPRTRSRRNAVTNRADAGLGTDAPPDTTVGRKRRNAVTERPDGNSLTAAPATDAPGLGDGDRSDLADVPELEEIAPAPADADAHLAVMSDEQRALFDGMTAEEIDDFLDQALTELAQERAADQS